MVTHQGVRRVEYSGGAPAGFDETEVPGAPLDLFLGWLRDAVDAGVAEPNAASLATVDESRRPALRTVLVKAVDERGFGFFTNHASRKATQMADNPSVALLFGWHAVHRQVAVRGMARPMGRDESAAYFATRPRGAQVGAWASRQSAPVTRRELEERAAQVEAMFAGREVPLPTFWGGYLVVADAVEFWAGRESRLHDRIEYVRVGPGGLADAASWQRRRLSP